ncbi:MAG: 50S ribosomal protein L11 methyltransferase [Lactobacillaceae bacterium]|jgi:ribosomal protein L11 methyltransferase|nr:50S ribosomal protein L11 methyltransferase [Lactobacillaceae bacterium]
MAWQEVLVDTQTEAVEAISNILMEAGAQGIQIEDANDVANFEPHDPTVTIDWATVAHLETGATVAGYFAEDINLAEVLSDVKSRVGQLAGFGLNAKPGLVRVNSVSEQAWATEWQKYYHPVRLTRYLTVLPKWETYEPTDAFEQVIVLDPGMAFGTGTHPTTQLMVQAEEVVIRGGERVLDVGTGSGVLSIQARLLGAASVVATDIDEVAVASAKLNLALNPIATNIEVLASDLLRDVPVQQFDVIVANMLSEVLVPLIPQMAAYVHPGTKILLSGIYYDKAAMITSALEAQNYVVDQATHLGDWYGIIAHVPNEDE